MSKSNRKPSNTERAQAAFDRHALAEICEMDEEIFGDAYDMETVYVDQPAPADYYHFRDNGSSILAVAHLDTVVDRPDRMCRFAETADGPVVFSGGLDDRLGAYTILEWLPTMGIQYDQLLTVGEEQGRSTAAFFETDKTYDYIIEFDRGGTDVVMYDYETALTRAMVKQAGAKVGMGSFSDISYMEHIGVKGFNWGVGYQDYHGPRAHAFLDDTTMMIGKYLQFHKNNAGIHLPHEKEQDWRTDEKDWWAKYQDHGHDDDDVWAEDSEHGAITGATTYKEWSVWS